MMVPSIPIAIDPWDRMIYGILDVAVGNTIPAPMNEPECQYPDAPPLLNPFGQYGDD